MPHVRRAGLVLEMGSYYPIPAQMLVITESQSSGARALAVNPGNRGKGSRERDADFPFVGLAAP